MKRWYVIQVYTGFEDLVKKDLEKLAGEAGFADMIDEILVPTGEVSTLFSDSEVKKEKIFPGYLLVHAEMTAELYELIRSNPRVTRFLGGESPVPLSNKEVERIFSQMSGKLFSSEEKETFVVGSEVHIAGGPFAGFMGVIEKVDEEKERLTVMVSIFGRMTPVELGFDQVKQ